METNVELLSKQDVIFEKLKQFISEIIGEDVAEELIITRDTIITKDLEMDSIEIVSLIDKVNKSYEQTIDLTSWIYNMDMDRLMNLSIDEIVVYISKKC